MSNRINVLVAVFITICLNAQLLYAKTEEVPGKKGNYIELKTRSSESFRGYITGPETSKKSILLIHGWWGLNREVERWADQFASSGYRVLAVDLFNSKVTDKPAIAKQLINSVKQTNANEKYLAAVDYMTRQGQRLAVVGRSWGATQALEATMAVPGKVSATIMYYPYGKLVSDRQKLMGVTRPVQAHFAEHDFFLTSEKQQQFMSLLKKSGVNLSANIYDARHGFDNPTSKNFNRAAQTVSWQRSSAFLMENLNRH